jgi:pimeloyl-ACP methyl ester carboxylesterase
MATMRLPDERDDIESYADFLEDQVVGLGEYILVGDSFGANISLAFATRQPEGLQALVLSGGFAANPITNPTTKLLISAAGFFPGPLYRQLILRYHASMLASPHDMGGQIPWPSKNSRRLFLENTPHVAYTKRTRASMKADYRDRLSRIRVSTLIITPSYDHLIGENAAREMLNGIPDAREVVLPETGHMFRYSHPETYASAIENFLRSLEREEVHAATGRDQIASPLSRG